MNDQTNEMKQNKRSEEVVDENVSHYRVQKLADGRIRIKSGGHVVVAETYYKALQAYAEREQELLEALPDHFREDQWNSVHHDTTNPETADVIANDADWIREEVVEDVASGETDISRSGAWLAEYERMDDAMEADLGRKIRVYKQWGARYVEADEE